MEGSRKKVNYNGKVEYSVLHAKNTVKNDKFANFKNRILCQRTFSTELWHTAWGASPEASKVFLKQKKAVRIIGEIHKRGSCRDAFKDFKILTLPAIFIMEAVLFVIDNPGHFKTNQEAHSRNTRNKLSYRPKTNLLEVGRQNVLYLGPILYNRLPSNLKALVQNRNSFKRGLKSFLLLHSYYTIDKFLRNDCKCETCKV